MSFWTPQSDRLEYSAHSFVGATICEASFDRSELSDEQLEQLGSLEFVQGTYEPGCDVPWYTIEVHDRDGTMREGVAAVPSCASKPQVIPYDDFDVVARSLGCATQ